MALFSVHVTFPRRVQLWVASISFTLIGALLLFVFPRYTPGLAADPIGAVAIFALGVAFLALGLLVLVPMLVSLYVARRHPGDEVRWHWWSNFIGGIAGALVFAVPATLMLPGFAIAYLMRPNVLFPPGVSPAKHLWLAALFTVLGVLTLVATWFLARMRLREKDRTRY